jgi:plastocyanin
MIRTTAMRRSLILIAALIVATPLAAQSIDWGRATRAEVRLSSFDFAPQELRLRAGQPVMLHLVNTGGGGHNFAAREFFAAATLRPEDRASVRNGVVEVAGNASRDIALVPRAGRYRLRCTHTLHTALGMSGTIIVE